MTTMVDEIFDRAYRESRGELNAALTSGFSSFGRTIMAAFEALHRISWQSPWAAPAQTRSN
jgi:hypothetical protein